MARFLQAAVQPAGADTDAVFQSPLWLDNLCAHGFLAPVQPLRLRQDTPAGPVSLELMTDAGGGLTGVSNYYSALFGPLGSAQALALWDTGLLSVDLRRIPGSVVLRLQPLAADSHWLPQLEQGLQKGGYWTDRYFCFGNWFQPVPPGGFDAYWATRPSALRNTVARARKRLDKQGIWRLEIVTQPGPGLASAIEAYTTVYSHSWKTPEPNPMFIPSLIRLAAEQGWLRLGLVWVEGVPVAAQLWLVAGGKANIFKLAYVQGQEKLSAGSVLTADLMRHVMDVDGVGEVDFLSGDDAYKADWMAQRRERVGLVAFDQRHWRGWLAALRHRLGRWRRIWRQG